MTSRVFEKTCELFCDVTLLSFVNSLKKNLTQHWLEFKMSINEQWATLNCVMSDSNKNKNVSFSKIFLKHFLALHKLISKLKFVIERNVKKLIVLLFRASNVIVQNDFKPFQQINKKTKCSKKEEDNSKQKYKYKNNILNKSEEIYLLSWAR